MGMPVKLSDDLVSAAREEAATADRSITAQIEHWAKLGRAVEIALAHPEVSALKRAGGNLRNAFADAPARVRIRALLDGIVTSSDRAAVTDLLKARGKAVYGTDPRHPGLIVRIGPDGKRTVGRIVNRRFEPARTRAAS